MKQKKSPARVDPVLAVELRKAGVPNVEIARQMGVTPAAITKVVRSLGFDRMKPGRKPQK